MSTNSPIAYTKIPSDLYSIRHHFHPSLACMKYVHVTSRYFVLSFVGYWLQQVSFGLSNAAHTHTHGPPLPTIFFPSVQSFPDLACVRRKTFHSQHNFIACLFPFFAHLPPTDTCYKHLIFFIWSHQILDIKLIYCYRRECEWRAEKICFWYDIIFCHSYWLLPWVMELFAVDGNDAEKRGSTACVCVGYK